MDFGTATVTCPCCATVEVKVHIVRGARPEEPEAWEVDDFDAPCDCHDFLSALHARFNQAGEAYYLDRLQEAVEAANA